MAAFVTSGRSFGRWAWQLDFMRRLWARGKTTMMVSFQVEKIPREEIKVFYDELKIYDFTN